MRCKVAQCMHAVRPGTPPQQTGWIRSGSVTPTQFRFFKEGMDHSVQNRPGSDVSGLVRVWQNASGLEANRWAGIIYQLPVSHCQTRLLPVSHCQTRLLPVSHCQTRLRSSTDIPDHIAQNQSGSDLFMTDCVRFWLNGSGPEASRCARIIRPTFGQCLRAGPDRMRIASGMFTGPVSAPSKGYTEKSAQQTCKERDCLWCMLLCEFWLRCSRVGGVLLASVMPFPVALARNLAYPICLQQRGWRVHGSFAVGSEPQL